MTNGVLIACELFVPLSLAQGGCSIEPHPSLVRAYDLGPMRMRLRGFSVFNRKEKSLWQTIIFIVIPNSLYLRFTNRAFMPSTFNYNTLHFMPFICT